ncbi:MAG: (2Fe-2S) ferredoxin domain-containing protein [Eubacteriales bacterium]
MVYVEVCVGSSCHLKGAPEIVELLENAVKMNRLEDEVLLSGSFCTGKCNRIGVTVSVNDEIYTGITKENFYEFWNERIMKEVERERN